MADEIGPASAKAVLCMGNGLYFSAMWEYGLASSDDERETDMEELLSADTPLGVKPAAGDGVCCRGVGDGRKLSHCDGLASSGRCNT